MYKNNNRAGEDKTFRPEKKIKVFSSPATLPFSSLFIKVVEKFDFSYSLDKMDSMNDAIQGMIDFSFNYDICAFALSVLVILYIVRVRSLGTFRNRVFFLYVITVSVISFLELVLGVLERFMPQQAFKAGSAWAVFHLILNCLSYSLIVFVPVIFLVYIFALVDFFQMVPEEQKNTLPFRIFFPIALSVFLIWISLFTGDHSSMFSYLDSLGPLKNGMNGYLVLFIVAYYYVIYGLVTMFQHKYRLEKQVEFHMLYWFFMLNVAILVQFFFKIRIASLGFAISAVQFSLFIQKPEFLTNDKTNVMNDRAFNIVISDYLVHGYNFKVILFCLEDTAFYHNLIGQKELADLESCIVRRIREQFRDSPLLKDENHGFYYLLFKNASDVEMDENIEFVNNQIKNRWGYSGLKFDFSFRVCIIDGKSDVSSVDELRNLANAFSRMNQYKGMCVKASEIDFSQMRSCMSVEKAIMNGEYSNLFTVEYQPIFSVADKKITRAETVLHFTGIDDMYVTTDSFISVFEKMNQFLNVNAIAFNSVCEMLSSIDVVSFGIHKIGINLSVVDCTQQDLFEQIKNRLEHYKVSSSNIFFEITQAEFVDFPDMITTNIQKLSEYGVEIVLDNFGLGNSNVEQFVDLSLGMIKIDTKAVSNAWGNSKIGIALKSMVKMAHELGIQVIANGVETMEQRIWLEGIGCDYLQGNFFSKPLPEEAFILFLQDQIKD